MFGAIQETDEGVRIHVLLQPKAARTEYVGIHGEALKFRVAAPPRDGEANDAFCRFLADIFRIPKWSVVVCSGQGIRRKRILLKGVSAKRVQEALRDHTDESQ